MYVYVAVMALGLIPDAFTASSGNPVHSNSDFWYSSWGLYKSAALISVALTILAPVLYWSWPRQMEKSHSGNGHFTGIMNRLPSYF
jgi:hypothetical protein